MKNLPSSYRDPEGFIFQQDGKFYRCVQPSFFENYNLLTESGLYKKLTGVGKLLPHEEIELTNQTPGTKTLLPQQIPFVSYPWEWSFDMWRDAALLTLNLVHISLSHGMILKDATPYNVQFVSGKAIFIDTLSFEKYEEGKPWIAYRQFCECFLAPMLLMHYDHRDAARIFLSFPNGIPVAPAKTLLPFRARFNLTAYLHIFLQAKISAKKHSAAAAENYFSKKKLGLLIKNLHQGIKKLKPANTPSAWGDYYEETILGSEYLKAKEEIVLRFAKNVPFKTITDLGANDGHFSLLFSDRAEKIIAIDSDSVCVNELYRIVKSKKLGNVFPVVADLNNPSPAIGWNNEERLSLNARLSSDLVFALALVHHLAIANNITLKMIADWLSTISKFLVIEFIPKEDEKVKVLLAHRKDIFPTYILKDFINTFEEKFIILENEKVPGTGRMLFLMQNRS